MADLSGVRTRPRRGGQTLDDVLRDQYFAKSTFPLMNDAGAALWEYLITALEKDATGTVAKAKAAALDPDRLWNPEMVVNEITLRLGFSDVQAFLGHMHARLSADHGVAVREPWQGFIQRVRALSPDLAESKAVLTADPGTGMGHGLTANPLTYVPDGSLGVKFGSIPDQQVIGAAAPAWKVLKRRAYENKGTLQAYGAKPHYVLAHLLNHNLNGPGNNALNVVPFWSTANTQMLHEAEKFVKDLVLRGAVVRYTVQQGAAVGPTPARAALIARIKAMGSTEEPVGDRAVQAELVGWEAHLPENFVINCDVRLPDGSWQTVVNSVHIDNYVPLTVPYLMPA